MPSSIKTWSAPIDSRLRRMRLDGASWDAIAEALAVSPEAASARAERIGARRPLHDVPMCQDPAREPLPAGHPYTWGVLTKGTWLEGTRYPAPVKMGSAA